MTTRMPNCKPASEPSLKASLASALCGALMLVAMGCEREDETNADPAADQGTLPAISVMADELAEIARNADPIRNAFLNDRRTEILRRELAGAADPQSELMIRVLLADELERDRQSRKAIDELLLVRERIASYGVETAPEAERKISELLALSYLRLGERENCLANHTSDSCLMPIQGGGVHLLPQGSQSAIAVYAQLLEQYPQSLGYRWLLNLGYMTLGRYPHDVPTQWLLPPATFESEFDIKRFVDVAGELGLNIPSLAGGSITEDFDLDGDLDIMCSSWGLSDQVRFFINNADGSFSDATEKSGLLGEVSGLNICHADYDNDGDADVLILRGAWLAENGFHPNSLLRNNGDRTFTNVTRDAGVYSRHPTQTAVWADFDNDGWLDLYIGNETVQHVPHPCELYRNNGNGTFNNIAESAGVANLGFVKGVTAGDFDNDGWMDLYLSRFGGENVLYRNLGCDAADRVSTLRFKDVAPEAGVTEPYASFPTWFFDYDNDGWLDIFVGSYPSFLEDSLDLCVADHLREAVEASRCALHRNNGDGTFTNVAPELGLDRVLLAMGGNFGDFDNDGWLDIYLGTGQPQLTSLVPNKAYRNDQAKRFQDVTTSGGLGHLQKGHAISFADLDRDGDQDIYTVLGGAFTGDGFMNALFLNPGHGHHWITLQLHGKRSNRAAVGARIAVSIATPAGPRTIHLMAGTGGSFGASSLQQEIGLGDATSITAVDVIWPGSGTRQKFTGLLLDRTYRLLEDEPDPEFLDRSAIALRGDDERTHPAHSH